MYRRPRLFESFDNYVSYLEAHKSSFPEHIYAFASSEERHNLTSPHSLHDSWLSSISIRELRRPESEGRNLPSIEIELLGPMHDRTIVLQYQEVHSYQISGAMNQYNWADTFHGDVSAHAILACGESKFLHCITFVSGSKIEVQFEEFKCCEVVCT
ncbi:hypothetical protein EA797_15675 [Stutzerimonas zhaodongensis]|uniref:Uncharacterized protein n=1 Tax=Stutzerimonas zhaodongensis TaxID=1176257 RepID=A0A3M2HQZ7_9GAMM|nr:hypothetical protein EA797_15675 [Stutzerimonas zhaodongensis]